MLRTKLATAIALGAVTICASGGTTEQDGSSVAPQALDLAREVQKKGWIVFSARSEKGDWDLFVMRPDGSERTNLTNTLTFDEAAPRFSPDGLKMLYRRLRAGSTVDHDKWGVQGSLVLAKSDGSQARVLGREGEYPWASWDPSGKRVSCLSKDGIAMIDLSSGKVLRRLDRKGVYQQLFWSPDGEWLCGTANHYEESWTVVRMNVHTGEVNPVSRFQNCTPDWFPDSKSLIFSYRPGNQGGYGWTQLWRAGAEGRSRALVYGEEGRHVYGGAVSPDGRYVLFTRSVRDGGESEKSGAPMALMRLRDAPIIIGESKALRKLHPQANSGPVLPLPVGWEPHWTYAQINLRRN